MNPLSQFKFKRDTEFKKYFTRRVFVYYSVRRAALLKSVHLSSRLHPEELNSLLLLTFERTLRAEAGCRVLFNRLTRYSSDTH